MKRFLSVLVCALVLCSAVCGASTIPAMLQQQHGSAGIASVTLDAAKLRAVRATPTKLRSVQTSDGADLVAHYMLDTDLYEQIGREYATFTRAGTVYYSDGSGTVAANQPRFETVDAMNALYLEPLSSNWLLYSRDGSQANWAKTNCTSAKDQTGTEGAANSASSITATGANATFLQTTAVASKEYTYSVFVKRITGTGKVYVTDNNDTNRTEITSSLSTGSWYRASITRTQASPVCGIKIETSGDKIAVDHNQLEIFPVVTSPIVTTTAVASRATESTYPYWTLPSGVFDDKGTVICLVRFGYAVGDMPNSTFVKGIVSSNDTGTSVLLHEKSAVGVGYVATKDQSNTPTKTLAHAENAWYKLAVRFSSSTGKFRVGAVAVGTAFTDSSWGTEATFDGSYTLGSYLRLAYDLYGPMWIRDVRVYNQVLDTTEIDNLGTHER